ncbi:glycerophosphodiester phosphodiesterase [Bacillus sp. CGMCC 1.16541]|uniref:glycerophosphodiester phosphodiesterase n=1 Tax=Bacillus sp. CGMCC 1.16541 TaxID=2185143 RepID=UPI000D72884A|nr:glycerophosphodiester phosphodiesterase [Bacillus sp. CGMCC 1.16541]
MRIFGHRGAAGTHPENTMISFKEAIRVGADGIELDVHMTKDNELVVIHDEKVDRTTNGKGYVKDLTYAEIKKLDASYKFKKRYGVCPIPTLEEVLQWASEQLTEVNIELKNNIFEYAYMEMKVIDLIYKYNMQNRVIISSFNHNSLARVISLDSNLETAVLYSYPLFEPWIYAQHLGAKALHPNYRTVNEVNVDVSRDFSLKVRPYTINDVNIAKQMYKYGCEAVITDYPEKMVQTFKVSF